MYRKTFAEINLDHLHHNYRFLKNNLAEDVFLCPMVKANAYGHGDVTVAKALEIFGVKSIGVCLIEEGILLRQFGIKIQILVFRGFDIEGAQEIVAQNLTPVVSDWGQLQALVHIIKQPYGIHIKFDTGMNRLGFAIQEAEKVFQFLRDHNQLRVEGVLTHLFQGEDGIDAKGSTAEQLKKFEDVVEIFRPLKPIFHVLNSGGTLSQIYLNRKSEAGNEVLPKNSLQQAWGVRPGLMMYGYNPLKQVQDFDLKPVMSLKSYVNVFRHVPRGQGISYNHTWRAKVDSTIAVVPIGYADGLHRLLSNRTEVLFQGQRVPLVGQVCMDYLMVDVTQVAQNLKPEEKEVVFFGYDSGNNFLSAEVQAQAAQTIPWEILTSIGERVPRVFVSEQEVLKELL